MDKNNLDKIMGFKTSVDQALSTLPEEPAGSDYNFIVDNLKDILKEGLPVFREAMGFASVAQDAEAFAAAATLIKSMAAVNKILAEVNIKRNEIKTPTEAGQGLNKGIMLHVTTADLQNMLREMDSKEKVITIDAEHSISRE